MKKMLKSALALAMGAVMLMPVTAFAAEDEPTLISTQEVALSPSGANTRSAETKEFTLSTLDCQHFFRQIFLGYFSDIVQAFDTLRKNVCGDDYTSLHNPIVLSSVLPAYGMFHSIQILFL